MKRRPTLRDVSEAANVSVFTVSRAMTTGQGVSASTQEHVRAVARELGYVPNQLARGLRGGTTRTVGILAANTTNPYYATLITSVERVLRGRDYHGLVMDAVLGGEYQRDREDAFVEDLIQHQVAAVVLTYAIAPENVSRLRDRGMELIFVDSEPPAGFEDLPSVNPDNYGASHLLGEHFAWHGYSGPWAFVGFPGSYGARSPREHGFVDAARDAGVEVHVVEGRNDAESAYLAFDQYLRDRGQVPRAVFPGNELLLQGVLRAVRERQLRIPEDIAIASYDDFSWAPYIVPAITVVDQKIAEIGSSAAAALLSQLDTPGSRAGERTQIQPRLIIRGSCGCTPDATGPNGPNHLTTQKQGE